MPSYAYASAYMLTLSLSLYIFDNYVNSKVISVFYLGHIHLTINRLPKNGDPNSSLESERNITQTLKLSLLAFSNQLFASKSIN